MSEKTKEVPTQPILILWLSKVLMNSLKGVIFIDSFTMQTLSILYREFFLDLFGFLRHYLLNVSGLSFGQHCSQLIITWGLN